MAELFEDSVINGTWLLDEMSTEFPGKPRMKYEGAKGTLIYDTTLKTVFARISYRDKTQPNGLVLFEYAGHYSFGEKPNEIVHEIEWSTNPKMVGLQLKREFNLTAKSTLDIIGPSPEYANAKVIVRWKKGQKNQEKNGGPARSNSAV